jgi:hypothetical protein
MDKTLAIRMFGSQAEMARALGLTRAAVHQWPDPIPEPRASQVREVARKLGYMRGNKVVAVAGTAVVKIDPIEVTV